MDIVWKSFTEWLWKVYRALTNACVDLQVSVMLWMIRAQLKATAKNVTPQTIVMCWILAKMNWCVDIVALWILSLYSVSGTVPRNTLFWVAVVCAAKPLLTTTLTTFLKKCGALTERVCAAAADLCFHVVHKLIECTITHGAEVVAEFLKAGISASAPLFPSRAGSCLACLLFCGGGVGSQV